jgi:hypothetical protein
LFLSLAARLLRGGLHVTGYQRMNFPYGTPHQRSLARDGGRR